MIVAAACGDAPRNDDRTSTSIRGTNTSAGEAPSSVWDADACDLFAESQVSALAGTQMEVSKEEHNEFSSSTCKYTSIPPVDPSAGRVLKLLLVDIYSGSQFFDLEGMFYPFAEREFVKIGDEGFVHLGSEARGVTVQISHAETVFSFNYTEQSLLTDEVADAASKADALVALIEETLDGNHG